MRSIWIFILFFLGGCIAAAQAPEAERPGSAWERSDGDFRLKFGVTLKGNTVEAEWKETAGRAMPEFEEITQVRRGQEFSLFLLFANCPSDATKRCGALVDYTLLGPEGNFLEGSKGLRLWTKPLPKKDEVRLGAAVLQVYAEKTDPPGKLTLRAVVTDPVTRKTLTLERPLELLP